MNTEYKTLVKKILELEREIRQLKANQNVGQKSFDQTVTQASYSHQHMPSALKSGSCASDIVFTGSITIPSATVTAHEADIDHDALTNFVANEHIDWTGASDNLSTSGTFALGAAAQDVNMAGYDIINPLEIRYSGTSRPFISMYDSNVASTYSGYFQMGRDENNRWEVYANHDVSGDITTVDFVTISNGGVGAAGFGDMRFLPDNVLSCTFKATGAFFPALDVNFAGGTTYKVEADGDATLKDLTVTKILAHTITGNVLHDGAGGDDERIRLPYLTGVPTSVDNGSIWMEADGLHIYYNGAEKTVAGV